MTFSREQWASLAAMHREFEASRRMLSYLGPLDRERDLTTDEAIFLVGHFTMPGRGKDIPVASPSEP